MSDELPTNAEILASIRAIIRDDASERDALRAELAEARDRIKVLTTKLGVISLCGITRDQFISQGPGLAFKRLREAVACAESALTSLAKEQPR